ncbi:MAG: hypothetical protein Q7J35_19005 [Candidatus Methanoperedens sp.]|nr:hypothetical protein [Candidatus Methanoperedens sp.]
MDILSFLLFFIYAMVILILLIYISPIISAIVMIILPLVIALIFPDPVSQFLSILQFSYMGVPVNNIHLMLMLWSALLGIIIYSELLSWYLLMDKTDEDNTEGSKEISSTDQIEPEEAPKTLKKKIEDVLLSLGKMMSGGK